MLASNHPTLTTSVVLRPSFVTVDLETLELYALPLLSDNQSDAEIVELR